MYQFHCAIKQITPMLHFQHGQSGAILRATEIKPKLDRFLLRALSFHGIQKEDIPLSWMIRSPDQEKQNVESLQYKLRVFAPDEIPAISNTACSAINNIKHPSRPIPDLYFGNQVTRETNAEEYARKVQARYKETVLYEKAISLRFVSFASGTVKIKGKKYTLCELIQDLLPLFFDTHAFGTRQTKGFGCFQVEDSGIWETSLLTMNDLYPVYYAVTYRSNRKDIGVDALEKIWALYGCMRSGFNLNARERNEDQKKKGRLEGFAFQYARDQMAVLHDKHFIRKKVLHLSPDLPDDESQYRLVRAMLGLTSEMLYAFDDKGGQINKTVQITDKKRENPVARFASPVRFHVLRKGNMAQILLLPENLPEGENGMFRRTFHIGVKGLEPTRPIQTPSSDEFSLIDFLDSFRDYFNQKSNFAHLTHWKLKALFFSELTMQRLSSTEKP